MSLRRPHRPAPRRRVLTVLGVASAACLLMLASPRDAHAQDPQTVVYSYEYVQFGDAPEWVLLPRAVRGGLSGDLESDVRAAFKALRNAKPPTYGGSSLNIDPKDLKKGKVTLQIDQGVAAYAIIIEAEVVHTLATLGIETVELTGAVSRTVTPGDIPFSAFDLTIPLWRALPPQSVPAGTSVRLANGQTRDAKSFQSDVASKESSAERAGFDALSKTADFSQAEILKRLPELALEDWQDQAAKRLSDESGDVQIAAINALAGTKDKDILDAMVRIVEKSESADAQAAAAAALAASGDKKYAASGVSFAMTGGDSAAAIAAIEEIVSKKITDAEDQLVAAMANPDAAVAQRAATALRELQLDGALRSALAAATAPQPILEHAATELTLFSDNDAKHAGHAWLAAKGSRAAGLEAVGSLQNTRDPEPEDALVAALDSPNGDVRVAAADALAAIKAEDALKKMAAAAETYADERIDIEAAIVQLLEASQKLSDLEDRTKKDKGLLRRAAFRALGAKAAAAGRSGAVRDRLVEGLEDGDAQARGGALIGLAAEPSDENLGLITSRATDASAQVQKDVALALGSFPAGKATDVLLSLAQSSEGDVAIAAIHAFGERRESVVVKDLVKLGKNDARVKRTLVRTLPAMDSAETRGDIVAFISNLLFDDDRDVKLAAIAALGEMKDEQSIGSLAMLVQDPDKALQSATFDALAKSGVADAVSLLEKGLESPDSEVRLNAIEALATHGTPAAKTALETHKASEQDAGVNAAIDEALGSF